MKSNSKLSEISSGSAVKNLFLLFLIFGGLYYAKSFLIPLTIGAILAMLFLPVCKALENKRFPKILAVICCLVFLLALIGGIVSLLGFQISELANDFTQVKQKVTDVFGEMQQLIFQKFGLTTKYQTEWIKGQQHSVVGMVSDVVSFLSSLLSDFIFVLTYFLLLLYYRGHIKEFILKLFPNAQQEKTRYVIDSAARVSQQYLLGLFKMIVCLWLMYGLGFYLLGVKNPITFAVLCGLLEIVPFIGNITGTSITLLVSAVNGANMGLLGGILLTYGGVQFIQGWFLEPLIVGPQVKINPLFTVIALILGEIVWGIPGVILAIPLTAIVKIVCDQIDALKPYGFLIGEIKSK